MKHPIVIAGAGPGATDLVTLRCLREIKRADLIIHAGSLVNPEILCYARKRCELKDSAAMSLPEIVAAAAQGHKAGKRVVRLHTGDPAMYGAIGEQMREFDRLGISYEVIPGVSSVFAAAAALKTELTCPGVSQTVILTRRKGRTPVPEGQDIASLAAHKATMCVFLSAPDIAELVEELIEGGYPPRTAAAVVYRASWDDQKIVRGELADIAGKVKKAGITRQGMVVVGDALRNEGEASLLYDPGFTHGYRNAKDGNKAGVHEDVRTAVPLGFKGRVAVHAITAQGISLARKIAEHFPGSAMYFPKRLVTKKMRNAILYGEGGFDATLQEAFSAFDGHVFVMAAGIVVRKVAPLLKGKTADPAVVVCDQEGRFAVSLLSGHIGGANRLARDVAVAVGAEPVVTTATDTQGVMAFDELAAMNGWTVENPEKIKILNSLLLEGAPITTFLPDDIFQMSYGHLKNINNYEEERKLGYTKRKGIVALDVGAELKAGKIPVLRLRSAKTAGSVAVGVGCRRGASASSIEAAVRHAVAQAGVRMEQIAVIASCDVKFDEEGLLAFAEKIKAGLRFCSAEELADVAVPTPSERVRLKVGTPSVSEAAAILASGGGQLAVKKTIHDGVTVAVAWMEMSRET